MKIIDAQEVDCKMANAMRDFLVYAANNGVEKISITGDDGKMLLFIRRMKELAPTWDWFMKNEAGHESKGEVKWPASHQ